MNSLNKISVPVEAIPSNPQQPTASTDPRVADLFTQTIGNPYLQSFLVQSAMLNFLQIVNLRRVTRKFRDRISSHYEWQIRVFRLFLYNLVLKRAQKAHLYIPDIYIDMMVEPDVLFAKAEKKSGYFYAESPRYAAILKRAAQHDEQSEKAVHKMINSTVLPDQKSRMLVDYLVYQGSLGKIEVLPKLEAAIQSLETIGTNNRGSDATRLKFISKFPFFNPDLLPLARSLQDLQFRGEALIAIAKLRARACDSEAISEALAIAEQISNPSAQRAAIAEIAITRITKNDVNAIADALRILEGIRRKDYVFDNWLRIIVKIILEKDSATAFDTASRLASTISDQHTKERAFMNLAVFRFKRGGSNAHSDAETFIRDNVSERNLSMAYGYLGEAYASNNTLSALEEAQEFLRSGNIRLQPWLVQKYAALNEEHAIERAYSLLPLVMEEDQEEALACIAIERAKKSDRGAIIGALRLARHIKDHDRFRKCMTEIIKVITPHHLPVVEESRHIFKRYYTTVQENFGLRQPTTDLEYDRV